MPCARAAETAAPRCRAPPALRLPATCSCSVPAGLSVDPGSAGLLGRRGPRSKQPFMVTFFRASSSPVRVTRAARTPRRRQPKKTNDLPHPNKLPGIFGKSRGQPPARRVGGDLAESRRLCSCCREGLFSLRLVLSEIPLTARRRSPGGSTVTTDVQEQGHWQTGGQPAFVGLSG